MYQNPTHSESGQEQINVVALVVSVHVLKLFCTQLHFADFVCTVRGKSVSEALLLESVNPQYELN